MIGRFGVPELLIVLALALLIFGPKKIGDLGKGLGEAIRGFKSSVSENDSESTSEKAKDSAA